MEREPNRPDFFRDYRAERTYRDKFNLPHITSTEYFEQYKTIYEKPRLPVDNAKD